MKQAKAFAPGNVSLIFRIIDNPNPKKKHSLGVGFTTRQGVIVTVARSKKTQVFFNSKNLNSPTINSIIKKLSGNSKLMVKIKSQLPLGSGFGLSGACTIATAYAINRLLNLKKSDRELAMLSHVAEVENKTGLGDIAGQYNGGFNIKLQKGNPLKVKTLNIKQHTLHYRFFKEIKTAKIIGNKTWKSNINKAGDRPLKEVLKIRSKDLIPAIFALAKNFALESKLMTKNASKVISQLEKQGGNATMIMLGDAVISTKRFKGSKPIHISKIKAKVL